MASSRISWRSRTGQLLSFAALWEHWETGGEPLESFTIITTVASPPLADIHHRQQAIIETDRFEDWLNPMSPVPRLLQLVREPRAGPYEEARRQYEGKQRPE